MARSRNKAIEALSAEFTEPVRDPLWGSVYMSPAFKALAASPPFAKLVGIRQLGPAFLAYPGATHTRQAHSLGVFHAARRLALALAEKGGLDFASPEGLASYLAAALCHDLGHFPFAHSLKELALASHEALGAALLREEPLRSLIEATGADPDFTAAIIDRDLPDPSISGQSAVHQGAIHLGAIQQSPVYNGAIHDGAPDQGATRGSAAGGAGLEGRELSLYRCMLSGVLDPDKLDYLSRDAWACGVPYGIQDAEYMLQRVLPAPGDRVGVDAKGLMSVESLLFAKYLMYKSVYWHPLVRAATSMVKKAVWQGLREGALFPEELYGLDDAGFIGLLGSRNFGAAGLARAVFSLSPWRLALDLPFEPATHGSLLDLEQRARVEEELAKEAGLSPLELVIDIPEPISFETELPVLEFPGAEPLPFSESATVFSGAVVEGFSRSLRRLRVYAARPEGRLKTTALSFLGPRDCENSEKVYT